MKNRNLLFALVLAASMSGCASDPLLKEDSLSLLKTVGTIVVNSALRENAVDRCADRTATSRGVSRRAAAISCRNHIEQAEFLDERRDQLEAEQSLEAVQAAFQQRNKHADNQDVIEIHVKRGSWIDQAEQQHSVVKQKDYYALDNHSYEAP